MTSLSTMGHTRHHAIIVTGPLRDRTSLTPSVDDAYEKALKIFADSAPVSPLCPAKINMAATFVVAPDGSKEGWNMSIAGNQSRDRFVDWLRTQVADDGSSLLEWLEVEYPGDGGPPRITRWSKSKPKRDKRPADDRVEGIG